MTANDANYIRLHRVLLAMPEMVYQAFMDSNVLTQWLPPNQFAGKVGQLQAIDGGAYHNFLVLT